MTPESRHLLVDSLDFAIEAHAEQTRKGGEIPYVSHLLQVSGAILEFGGSVTVAAAGLLHDVVEDCEQVEVAGIRSRFGDPIADIVDRCSDTLEGDVPEQKSPWIDRKRQYLAKLSGADRDVLLVAACDKLDNLRSLVADLHAEGPATLERFTGTRRQTRWYYESVREVLTDEVPKKLLDSIDSLLRELRDFVSESSPEP
jgi:(p)ppGpp synthase/HD superfamily hydrolase